MPVAGTLITVAPTGAETAKEDASALPVTCDELAETARRCAVAGAAVIHVHVRDRAGRSTLDVGAVRAAIEAVRAAADLVVQVSTGGSVHDTEAARLAVLDAGADAASLTCGTVNFGADVFVNRWPFMVQLYRGMQERGIVPEFEIFDLGQAVSLHRLLDKCGPPPGGHVHCDLVLGVPGGMPGSPAALLAAANELPPGATFSVTGMGRTTLPVALTALAVGGHLRVGMEDTLSFAPGQPVRDNAQLVQRAATLARLAQRPPLSVPEARQMLGVHDRSGLSVVARS